VFHWPHRACNALRCALLCSWTSVRHPLVPCLCRQHCQARAGRNGCHHELGCGRMAHARVRPLDEHHLRHLRGARLTRPRITCRSSKKRTGAAAHLTQVTQPAHHRRHERGLQGRQAGVVRGALQVPAAAGAHERMSRSIQERLSTAQQQINILPNDRRQHEVALVLTQTSAATTEVHLRGSQPEHGPAACDDCRAASAVRVGRIAAARGLQRGTRRTPHRRVSSAHLQGSLRL